jgi:hypothetical protein
MNGNSYGSSVCLWLSPGSGVVSETSAVEFDLCCVALARSASWCSNRSPPARHPSSSSASSKVVLPVLAYTYVVASFDCPSRLKKLHVGTFLVFVTGLFSYSFPLFSSNSICGSFVYCLVRTRKVETAIKASYTFSGVVSHPFENKPSVL